ncbi:cobalamin biosynthesis protein [Kitasatospora sp. GP82]|uniref:cobalamin biosynthesis protein n=1 Tax=Kitasatospora sp. GP82 TaxID=3035089 RepID=UPI0032AEAA14
MIEGVCPVRESAAEQRPAVVGIGIGIGASRGVTVGEVLALVDSALAEARLERRQIALLATVERRAGEPGLRAAARELGVPLVAHRAEALAAVVVPNPSPSALATVGTASVAEAAALLSAAGGPLLVPKRKSARVTVAVSRLPSHPGAAT